MLVVRTHTRHAHVRFRALTAINASGGGRGHGTQNRAVYQGRKMELENIPPPRQTTIS